MKDGFIVIFVFTVSKTFQLSFLETRSSSSESIITPRGGGGVLPYMSYIGMCRPKGYGV